MSTLPDYTEYQLKESEIVMDYHVFIPIPIFLPLHLLLYLVIDTVFPFSVLAIKAVAQQRHSPNQGTLVS